MLILISLMQVHIICTTLIFNVLVEEFHLVKDLFAISWVAFVVTNLALKIVLFQLPYHVLDAKISA